MTAAARATGIPCSADDNDADPGYGIAVVIAIIFFCMIGIVAAYKIKGDYTQFFVGGRTLSLPVVTLTLASQCIDSNSVRWSLALFLWGDSLWFYT